MANAVRLLSWPLEFSYSGCSSWAPLMLMWKRFTCFPLDWHTTNAAVWQNVGAPPTTPHKQQQQQQEQQEQMVLIFAMTPTSIVTSLFESQVFLLFDSCCGSIFRSVTDCQQLAWSSWSLLLSLAAAAPVSSLPLNLNRALTECFSP